MYNYQPGLANFYSKQEESFPEITGRGKGHQTTCLIFMIPDPSTVPVTQ